VDLDLVCFSASHDGYGFVVDVGKLDGFSRVFLGGGGGSCIGKFVRFNGRWLNSEVRKEAVVWFCSFLSI
jgi:hypothetical protein